MVFLNVSKYRDEKSIVFAFTYLAFWVTDGKEWQVKEVLRQRCSVKEYALPPGSSIQIEWKSMGEDLINRILELGSVVWC